MSLNFISYYARASITLRTSPYYTTLEFSEDILAYLKIIITQTIAHSLHLPIMACIRLTHVHPALAMGGLWI